VRRGPRREVGVEFYPDRGQHRQPIPVIAATTPVVGFGDARDQDSRARTVSGDAFRDAQLALRNPVGPHHSGLCVRVQRTLEWRFEGLRDVAATAYTQQPGRARIGQQLEGHERTCVDPGQPGRAACRR
jgi:hypothetical protein